MRRAKCSTTSNTPAAALANSSCVAPIPLPPKKHQRSSSSGREPRETTASATYNANKCDDHEYDEYCPGAYEPQGTHHQSQRQIHLSAGLSSSSAKHQQRSATFDVADAREYELKRLGNRRSQSQNATNLKQNRNGGLMAEAHHRGERTHDRERSRSDHRIASYACDDSSLAMSHAFSGNVANGGLGQHHNHHQQQQMQQQQHRQQQRREKTFKV